MGEMERKAAPEDSEPIRTRSSDFRSHSGSVTHTATRARGALHDEACDVLATLRARLALDDSDLACMLRVSPEMLSRWGQPWVMMAPEARARIIAAGAALDRLLALFTPENLPQVIRRPAELFDGKCALDWILEGRIAEVADRYDAALSYQA